MTEDIVNRVAASSLITFDLEEYFTAGDRVQLDIKDQLFQGLVLKEKDFRNFIKTYDWSQHRGKLVAVHCSIDAIIPNWAYMLVAIALEPFARKVIFGSLEDLEVVLFREALANIDWSTFKDAKVVIKGCSKVDVPVALYVDVAARLKPFAASLMFGEPCSTVPLYKRKSG